MSSEQGEVARASDVDYSRIVVVGPSGAGKTTLGRDLSQRLHTPHVELDSIHWGSNWIALPTEEFRQQVQDLLSCDRWVVDGNYSMIRDITWGRATTLVWLDYPLPLVLSRLWKRSYRRLRTQEELWNGNRESLRDHLSRDGLLYWTLSTYRKRRREFPLFFLKPEYAHLNVVRLQTPKATRDWLSHVPCSTHAADQQGNP